MRYKDVRKTPPNKLDMIREKCSDIIKLYNANPIHRFYRGITEKEYGNIPEVLFQPKFQGRRPKDTNLPMHKITNEAMRKQGLIATRSNSFFSSSDKQKASAFGMVYTVYPVNGFSFSYSPICYDYTSWYSDIVREILSNNKEVYDKLVKALNFVTGPNVSVTHIIEYPAGRKWFRDVLFPCFGYTDKNLTGAFKEYKAPFMIIPRAPEIMFHGDAYFINGDLL